MASQITDLIRCLAPLPDAITHAHTVSTKSAPLLGNAIIGLASDLCAARTAERQANILNQIHPDSFPGLGRSRPDLVVPMTEVEPTLLPSPGAKKLQQCRFTPQLLSGNALIQRRGATVAPSAADVVRAMGEDYLRDQYQIGNLSDRPAPKAASHRPFSSAPSIRGSGGGQRGGRPPTAKRGK
jgi:hypothetical protein